MALVLPLGVWGLIGGWAAGQAAALVWMRRAGVAVPLRPLARPPLGELLGAGFVISAFFATALVVRSADRFAFLRYLGNEPLGHYSLGFIAAGLVLYLPEAAGYVLYPRVAAAAGGARDPQPARLQTLQVQRALCVALPLAVGLGVLWVEPTLRALLPTYLPGAPAVRVLACGALMLSAATVPSYYLLGTGHERGLLALGAVAALFTTALVFRAAVVGHNATAVAWAAATGDVTFSLLVVGFAAGVLAAGTAARLRFVAGSFLPALWGSALALALARWRPGVGGALAASAVFTAAYAPVLVLVGRGAGFGRLAREFFPAGAAARSGA
jgi:O-antigen/teichoic acid export membrane protein